jgi:hypothetical protein
MSIIDDPTLYFSSTIWTGNGVDDRNIVIDGTGMQPDFVWIKSRNDTDNHRLVDSVRGATKHLESDGTGLEQTSSNVKAFTSTGVTLSNNGSVNANSELYASWSWKETATAGFDIVSYTGNGSARTISHSLSAIPKMIIIKNRDDTDSWRVYHASTGNGGSLMLNLTNAFASDSTMWNNTSPTSSVFSLGDHDNVNGNGHKFIAYLFAEKQGYSKFSSYVGNGQDTPNGVFTYLGFTPAFILIKATDSNSWVIVDNKRPADSNPVDSSLAADSTATETTGDINTTFDFLSNGFRTNGNSGNNNSSGQEYIFMAFASNPFVTSTGVPATAR